MKNILVKDVLNLLPSEHLVELQSIHYDYVRMDSVDWLLSDVVEKYPRNWEKCRVKNIKSETREISIFDKRDSDAVYRNTITISYENVIVVVFEWSK